MELGQRLKEARLEKGFSQRQLCGEVITRNMLSQIENGAARPSMDTLRYLAGVLGKPLSYFLDEDTVTSPNQSLMAQARQASDPKQILEILKDYRQPDEIFQQEKELLYRLATLDLAERSIGEERIIYGTELLEELGPVEDGYCAAELERRRLLLLGRVKHGNLQEICGKLPSLDEELMLRARDALEREDYDRCGALLETMEVRDETWQVLRGKVHLAHEAYADALVCFRVAEESCPEVVYPLMEQCARELNDYKLAYEYACKQKASP